MKGIWVACAVGAVQVFLLAGVAQAVGAGFFDGFDTFDAARWTEEDHALGRSQLDPSNVAVQGGNLRIALPARTLKGGEVFSNDLHGYGSYSARMKLPNAPSSITGFFLYKAPDYQSEIDVEIYNDSTRRVMFTTYADGGQTHTTTMQLPFDPTTDFHDYSFDYVGDASTGKASVVFYADGKPMKSWDTGIPNTPMHLMVNSWFPTWLDGRKPKKTIYTQIDRIRYDASSEAVAATPTP